MISLNETETKALYIINKRSKEIRDQKKLLREKVKKILFENDDIGITPDDMMMNITMMTTMTNKILFSLSFDKEGAAFRSPFHIYKSVQS